MLVKLFIKAGYRGTISKVSEHNVIIRLSFVNI